MSSRFAPVAFLAVHSLLAMSCARQESVSASEPTSGGPSEVQTAETSVRFTAEPVSHTFGAIEDVAVRLTIETPRQPCMPVVISSLMSPVPSPVRFISVVNMTITKVGGDKVEQVEYFLDRGAAPSAAEVITLPCGASYAREITLYDDFVPKDARDYRDEWTFLLEPGRYTLDATLELTVRSFFESNRELVGELGILGGGAASMDWNEIRRIFPEGTFTSPRVEFVVR